MMVLRLLSLLVIFALVTLSIPAEARELKIQKIDETPAGEVFIHYDPNLTKIIMADKTEPGGNKEIRIAQTKLTANSSDEFVIDYWEGPSVDPGFLLYHVEKSGLKQVSLHMGGLYLAVPGDGYLYTWGHVNSDFNLRQKFTFENGRITEVKQSFYYVGLKAKTLSEIIIYQTQEQKKIVAKIKKGDPVSVILNDGQFYLLKTEREMLGWWHPKAMSYFKAEEIDGIFRLGD